MRVIPKDKVILSFNADTPFNYTVEDGETFWVETDDCYRGQIADESVLRPDIDGSVVDCSVGPIEVRGARPGDTLCVEVLDIRLAPRGLMVTFKGLGVLGERAGKPESKIVPIRDGFAYLTDTIRLPLSPMIGVCGVAPGPGMDVSCEVPGDHGSNMDTKLLKVGSKLYLPVSVPGAGLAIGDLHACMGDGELSGTGIETAGRVLLRTTVRRDRPVERPVIETAEGLYFIASAATAEEGIKIAASDAVGYLMRRLKLNFSDAYRLLGAACDAQISQVVNDLVTARVRVPKSVARTTAP